MSKWKIYDNDIRDYLTSYPESSDFQTAKFILKHDIKTAEVDTFRTYIKRNRKRILGIKEKEMIELCNYKNLQPLWAKDNLSKGSKKTNPSN